MDLATQLHRLPTTLKNVQNLESLALESMSIWIDLVTYHGEDNEMNWYFPDSKIFHSNSNGCHLNIGLFPICQFGNIPAKPARPLFPRQP